MIKKLQIILLIIMFITGITAGYELHNKNNKIKELKKENKIFKKELDDYSWQIEQIPYVVKYWCSKE